MRATVERDLAVTLEGEWGLPVELVAPDGEKYAGIKGQVLYETVRLNPESGERVVIPTPVVTLRRSTLPRVPAPGERWLVSIPASPIDLTMVPHVISPTRAPEGGESIGFIRLYLQQAEQVPAP